MQRGMQSYVVVTRLFPALGIRKECDGGTEWERVEVGDCPLTLPTQDVQVRPFQVVYTSVLGPKISLLLCMQEVCQQHQ